MMDAAQDAASSIEETLEDVIHAAPARDRRPRARPRLPDRRDVAPLDGAASMRRPPRRSIELNGGADAPSFRSQQYFSNRGVPMFARMIDDFKDSTGTAVRLTSLAAVAALGAVRHDLVSVRRGLCLRAAELWPDPGLPDRRRHVLCRDADRGRLLHGAQEAGQGRAARRPRNPRFTPRWPIRCWSPPASR